MAIDEVLTVGGLLLAGAVIVVAGLWLMDVTTYWKADMNQSHSLDYYLNLEYPFRALADPDGGYVIDFPDLPGCFTQAESIEELPEMAEDARKLWIEAAYEDGQMDGWE